MRILLIQDDDSGSNALITALAQLKLDTVHARSARLGIASLTERDTVLLDFSLPDIDGIKACESIRTVSAVPIIILARRTTIEDRIKAFLAGADDYVIKPFSINELLARIHAINRRSLPQALCATVRVGDVVIDLRRQSVTVAGDPVNLTRKEFRILALLARQNGRICTREMIVAEVWGKSWADVDNTLNVHIAMIRAKTRPRELIATVRGVGYRLSHSKLASQPAEV